MKKTQAQYAIGRLEHSQFKILMELRESERTLQKFPSQAHSDRTFAFQETADNVTRLYESAINDLNAKYKAGETD